METMKVKVYICNKCNRQIHQYYFDKQIVYYCNKCKVKSYHGSVASLSNVKTLSIELNEDNSINRQIEVVNDIIIDDD